MVLLFAGPSGHGKTELARQLGNLISLDLLTIDCTNMHSGFDLWGPVKPYMGYSDGSKLNNFLAEHSGRRSMVFLDEFEKMGQEIRNTLLLPIQAGKPSPPTLRRTHLADCNFLSKGICFDLRKELLTLVDCSKTIWIMATNALDETIHAFCNSHEKVLFSDEPGQEGQRLVQKLSRSIQKESVTKFGVRNLLSASQK